MTPDAPWPPSEGELLPRGAEAVGVRHKLATYSLDSTHEDGGPKARGFERILGVTIEDIDYLAEAIEAGILDTAVSQVRDNPPHGINCVVDIPVRGIHAASERVIDVRTAWLIADATAPPRLVSAYPRP
jgi:hypothetical protein